MGASFVQLKPEDNFPIKVIFDVRVLLYSGAMF